MADFAFLRAVLSADSCEVPGGRGATRRRTEGAPSAGQRAGVQAAPRAWRPPRSPARPLDRPRLPPRSRAVHRLAGAPETLAFLRARCARDPSSAASRVEPSAGLFFSACSTCQRYSFSVDKHAASIFQALGRRPPFSRSGGFPTRFRALTVSLVHSDVFLGDRHLLQVKAHAPILDFQW